MGLEIKEIFLESSTDVNDFINFPWKLYKNNPNWTCSPKGSHKKILSSLHPFYQTSEYALWLAIRNSEVVGRIMAVVNHHHNSFHNERCGFFGFYESIDDLDVSNLLLTTAKNWLKNKKMEEFRGPVNPSTNHETGLLTVGFDEPPQIMMPYNTTYYANQFEEFGLKKAKDLIAYQLDMDFVMPEKILRISNRLEKSNRISYRPLSLKNFNHDIKQMFSIYNDAWEKNWCFVPMTEDEFFYSAKQLKPIVDPNLIQFVEVAGEVVGFAVALPDYNQVFKTIADGNLLPFGFVKFLRNKKKINRIRVMTLGIKKSFSHLGLATLLYNQLYKEARSKGYTEAEISWIPEDNKAVNAPLKLMGAKDYKYYRIFNQKIEQI